MASMTSAASPEPFESSTLRLIRCAAGAMPESAPSTGVVEAARRDDAGDVRAVTVEVVALARGDR